MASRTHRRVLLGCALLCVAALPCADSSRLRAAESQSQPTVAAANFPIASAARLAGDGKQTRFILDINQAITFRAVTLADPYRVVVDVPQVNFQLPAGTGAGGRGLVKAFRYGLVMPGGSRIVFDLTGPAKIAKSYVVEAANGQPARLVLELEEVDRAAFMQALAPESRPELRPTIAEAQPATAPATTGPETAQQKSDGRGAAACSREGQARDRVGRERGRAVHGRRRRGVAERTARARTGRPQGRDPAQQQDGEDGSADPRRQDHEASHQARNSGTIEADRRFVEPPQQCTSVERS